MTNGDEFIPPSGDDPRPYALIAHIKLSDDAWGDSEEHDPFWDLEDRLTEAIESAGVGEFDGVARGLGFFDLYMDGPDADRLLAVVEPILLAYPARPGSYIEKRDEASPNEYKRISLWQHLSDER